MQKLNKIFGILLLSILLLGMSGNVYAQEYSPTVFVVDQDVVDGQVVVARAVINGPGWIAIHADANGAPGPVIGYAPLISGINADISVAVDAAQVTDVLYAMLHVDKGTVGTYEFPGVDAPLMMNDTPLTPAFKVTGTSMTLINTLMTSDGFKTLEAAIKSAGLEQELKGAGPFTLFAPTDAAFAELPKEQLAQLMADPAVLREVLLYHVLPGKVVADDLKDGMETATVQGATVKFSLSDGRIRVNDATVSAQNIAAHNGVVHVIDKVLTLPASAQVTGQAVTETTELTTTAAMTSTAMITPTAAMTLTEMNAPSEIVTPTEMMTPTAMMTETAAASADQRSPTPAVTVIPEATVTPEPTAMIGAQETSVVVTPQEMPATGASFSSASTTLPAVLFVFLVLVAFTFVTRQRST